MRSFVSAAARSPPKSMILAGAVDHSATVESGGSAFQKSTTAGTRSLRYAAATVAPESTTIATSIGRRSRSRPSTLRSRLSSETRTSSAFRSSTGTSFFVYTETVTERVRGTLAAAWEGPTAARRVSHSIGTPRLWKVTSAAPCARASRPVPP